MIRRGDLDGRPPGPGSGLFLQASDMNGHMGDHEGRPYGCRWATQASFSLRRKIKVNSQNSPYQTRNNRQKNSKTAMWMKMLLVYSLPRLQEVKQCHYHHD